jgi:hypothetical protein
MIPKILPTASDTLALTTTGIAGVVTELPPVDTIKTQILIYGFTKLLAALPGIIRSFRRPAPRKAAVHVVA